MKKTTRFMSACALTGMIGITTAAPVFAAETATGGTEVTYTANSASPDLADWLVSYPKKVVLSDFNDAADKGVSLPFALHDKLTSSAYSGNRTITVSVGGYNTGFDMTGTGTSGTVTMGIADSTKTELSGPGYVLGTMKKQDGGAGTQHMTTGYGYLKTKANPEGKFTTTVTFTFTDDAA